MMLLKNTDFNGIELTTFDQINRYKLYGNNTVIVCVPEDYCEIIHFGKVSKEDRKELSGKIGELQDSFNISLDLLEIDSVPSELILGVYCRDEFFEPNGKFYLN